MPEYSHNIRIRKMSTEDLMEVARIEKETFSLPWSQQGFADSLAQENTCYLVASIGEKLVGYCGFLQVLDEADITNVAVDAACRKCGVGERMLLEASEAGEDRWRTGHLRWRWRKAIWLHLLYTRRLDLKNVVYVRIFMISQKRMQ